MFSDIRTKTVAFPDVAVGDTVVLSYKLTQKEADLSRQLFHVTALLPVLRL